MRPAHWLRYLCARSPFRVCFCVAYEIKSFWHLLRVHVCVFVCAPRPRAEGIKTTVHTHTHGAQHAIWLPCTRRSTLCGSFSMPISCRAYWLNRAPARLTDSAQTQPKPQLSFSSATTSTTNIAAASAAAVAASSGSVACITLAIRIWNSAQQFVCRISRLAPSSIVPLFGCYWCQPASWNLAWKCTADGTSFAFIIRLSRAISAEVERVPGVVLQHDAAKKREMQNRKIKDWKKSFQISLYHIQYSTMSMSKWGNSWKRSCSK